MPIHSCFDAWVFWNHAKCVFDPFCFASQLWKIADAKFGKHDGFYRVDSRKFLIGPVEKGFELGPVVTCTELLPVNTEPQPIHITRPRVVGRHHIPHIIFCWKRIDVKNPANVAGATGPDAVDDVAPSFFENFIASIFSTVEAP